MKFSTILLALLSLYSCATGKKSSESSNVAQLVEKYTINGFEYEFNQDSSYLLCYKKEYVNNMNGFYKLKIFVVSAPEGNVEYENELNFGSVKWIKRDVIELKSGLGYMHDNSNATKIIKYDVRQKKVLLGD